MTADSLAPFSGFSHILFQANGDITIAASETLNLGAGSGQLTLAAGGDITFGDGSSISDANNWSVTLKAGVGFPSEVVQSGSGSIYLTGGQINGVTQTTGGSIQTAGGFINLEAGQDIQAGSGSLMDNNGYNFAIESGSGSMTLSAGRDILADLGTIATLWCGGITATAGRNIQWVSGPSPRWMAVIFPLRRDRIFSRLRFHYHGQGRQHYSDGDGGQREHRHRHWRLYFQWRFCQ